MRRYIHEEMDRLGIDDLEDINRLKELGLTTANYPEYQEEIMEAVMNMLDIPLEKAIEIWDNDNTRFDYYECCGVDRMYPFVTLGLARLEDLEEIESDNDYTGFAEEIMNIKTRINDPEKISTYLINNGWMMYEDVAIGWDLDELNKVLG